MLGTAKATYSLKKIYQFIAYACGQLQNLFMWDDKDSALSLCVCVCVCVCVCARVCVQLSANDPEYFDHISVIGSYTQISPHTHMHVPNMYS